MKETGGLYREKSVRDFCSNIPVGGHFARWTAIIHVK